jgi:hypothetical protein
VRTVADLQRAGQASGCRLVTTRTLETGELLGEYDCPDIDEGQPMATARLLEALSAGDEDADPLDEDLLEELAQAPDVARAAHAYVLEHVTFRDEKIETFAAPSTTLRVGYGDCDDSERVLLALARSLGLRARYVYFLQQGQPAHVTVQICDDGRWRWAETSIPAHFGEHPFEAMKRLKLNRADLDGGTPWILQNGVAKRLSGASSGGPMSKVGVVHAMQGIGDASAWPSYLGDTFASSLVTWSKSIGVDPLDALKLFLSESGLQPTATNSNGFPSGQYAAGINQLSPGNWSYFAPMSAGQYTSLTAEQQLPYAFAYWKAVANSHNLTTISGADLYWLNFLPATFVPFATDDHVIVTSASGYYTNNTGLDHGSKGYITKGDLRKSLDAQESIHTTLWPLVSAAVLQDEGGISPLAAGVLVVMAAAIGVALVRPDLILDLWP